MMVLIAGIWLNTATVTAMYDREETWATPAGCMVYSIGGRYTFDNFIEGYTCQQVADILNGVQK